jgi:predicted DNA-binding transcriptional regulator AlpA
MSTQTQPKESERLAVSAADLAKMLDISERHLWAMLADGRLGPQPFQLGRARRWFVDEVRTWLAAGAPIRAAWERIKSGGPLS